MCAWACDPCAPCGAASNTETRCVTAWIPTRTPVSVMIVNTRLLAIQLTIAASDHTVRKWVSDGAWPPPIVCPHTASATATRDTGAARTCRHSPRQAVGLLACSAEIGRMPPTIASCRLPLRAPRGDQQCCGSPPSPTPAGDRECAAVVAVITVDPGRNSYSAPHDL